MDENKPRWPRRKLTPFPSRHYRSHIRVLEHYVTADLESTVLSGRHARKHFDDCTDSVKGKILGSLKERSIVATRSVPRRIKRMLQYGLKVIIVDLNPM